MGNDGKLSLAVYCMVSGRINLAPKVLVPSVMVTKIDASLFQYFCLGGFRSRYVPCSRIRQAGRHIP